GTGTPEYAKCVDISTKAALKEMLLPGLLTIITPIIIGLLFGAEPLGGYMAGVCVSGVMWAIFQNNAGGAWDNAKKSFEAGVEINGEMTYKGSDAHKAAVTGDTVGDPFKDTSGPSMNILIKLTCLVGLVIAPILGGHATDTANVEDETEMVFISEDGTKTILSDKVANVEVGQISKEVKVAMSVEGEETVATVTIETTTNGETTTETKTFRGTEAEVKAQLEAMKEAEVKVENGKKVIKEVIEEVEKS
ncbi:MAG: sodium/proton-translocating pyrophosphatase, partial [Flavobacteriaceae bacterium]|nr:sodium/proton-translocating pyrophosphatase [Flavobacteriaceae bacterium]